MRSVSFAGLHRILNAVADAPNGLTASEINDLVLKKGVTLTRRNPRPAPTTLYHYRNTLLHLHALERAGRRLRANIDNPDVSELLRLPAPVDGDQSLNAAARERFTTLVLRNEQCRSLFFNLFMPSGTDCFSAAAFRNNSISVEWSHHHSSGTTEVVFRNPTTGRTVHYTSPTSKAAIKYGLRYWARDELQLIDEYCPPGGASTTMFPLSRPPSSTAEYESSVMQTVQFMLSLRTSDEWTVFSIFDLIVRYCEPHRQPRTVLFDAIDWLLRKWPYHTALITTSPALATLTATSSQRENFELRRYYRHSNGGPYVSHIRVHEDVTMEPMRVHHHVQYT